MYRSDLRPIFGIRNMIVDKTSYLHFPMIEGTLPFLGGIGKSVTPNLHLAHWQSKIDWMIVTSTYTLAAAIVVPYEQYELYD